MARGSAVVTAVLLVGCGQSGTVRTDATQFADATDTDAMLVDACIGAGCPKLPVVMTSGETAPNWTRTDGTYLFWVSGSDGNTKEIRKCAIANCAATVTTLVADGLAITGFAVDDTNVYWSDSIFGYISTCAKTGCASPTRIATGRNDPHGVAIGFNNVFWTEQQGTTGIYTCAKAGCSNSPSLLAADAAPIDLAADVSNVYWTSNPTAGTKSVRKCATSGCSNTPTTLAPNLTAIPMRIAINGTTVFWVDGTNSVQACPMADCSAGPATLATNSASFHLTADAFNAYWTSLGATLTGGFVRRCAVGGCNQMPTDLAMGQAGPIEPTMDSANIYWADNYGGYIMRIGK